jgi:hypothetical protein
MLLVGFEPTISADKWPYIYAVHHAATGTGVIIIYTDYYENFVCAAWNTKGRLLRKPATVLPIYKSEKAEDHKSSAPHNKIVYKALRNTSTGNGGQWLCFLLIWWKDGVPLCTAHIALLALVTNIHYMTVKLRLLSLQTQSYPEEICITTQLFKC